jgi:hypothetical protein
VLIVLTPALAQKTIYSPGPCSDSCSEIFDKGHLIYLTSPAHIEVFDREGLRMFQTIVVNPAGRSISSMRRAAIDTDDTVAVTASWDVAQGYAGGIVLFDRSGKQTRTIETSRFMPLYVTFDENHYIWVFGWQRDEEDRAIEDRKDYSLVLKFSQDGKEEGRVLSRGRFPGWTGGIEIFQAAKDRIGMLVAPRSGRGEYQWIEFDFQGKLLGNWRVGERTWFDMAYTGEGRLYSRDHDPKTGQYWLVVFDREIGTWKRLTTLDSNPEHDTMYWNLLGSDGEQIVIDDPHHEKLIWMQVK